MQGNRKLGLKAGLFAVLAVFALMLLQNLVFRDDGRATPSTQGDMPKFSEIVYTRPDLEHLTQLFDTLIEDLEADRLELKEAVGRLETCYSAYVDYYTLDTVAELRSYHDLTDEYYAAESDWFLETEPEVDQLFESLCVASANCKLAKKLDEEFWGGWVVDAYQGQEDAALDEEYLALARKENAILSEYRRAISEPTVTWRGRETSYWELEQDPDLTEAEWEEVQALYYDKYETILGDVYIRLVAARQEMAAYYGYQSYEDFAYEVLYGREYTPAEADVLLERIQTNLAPLYKELSLHERADALEYTEVDEEEIFEALQTAAWAMGGTINSAFQDMAAYELYDIDISEKKAGISYQCYLGSYENPYVFVKTLGWSDDILSFGHEFGHFVDSWYNYDATVSYDLAEVFSQGMEFLLLTRIPEEYREELTAFKLVDTVDTFAQQASFAAFEREVYSKPASSWTPEALSALSLQVAKDYGYCVAGEEDYYAKSWIDIAHFFSSPFYVVSYCVSLDAAFQIYELECAELGSGLSRWNRMLPRDSDSFLETVVNQGGLEDPFSPQRMTEIAALLREKLK